MSTPVLRLMYDQFPYCRCGHLRIHHKDDVKIQGTGKCEHSGCDCKIFTARPEDLEDGSYQCGAFYFDDESYEGDDR